MGTKLTGTLVAANLVAVSGFAGLQLYGAIQSLDAEAATPQIARVALHGIADQPTTTMAALYPEHPIRVMTRGTSDDGGPTVLVTPADPGTAPEVGSMPRSDPPSMESPSIAAAKVLEDQSDTPTVAQVEIRAISETAPMAETAENLSRITTAAGPSHAMSNPVRLDRGSPQEAWRASRQLQVAYRARLIETSPGPAASTEAVASKSVTPKAAPAQVTPGSAPSRPAVSGAVGDIAGRFVARLMVPNAIGAEGYVIVSSYGTRESATVEAARFGHWQPTIMPAKVKGKDYFRVAIGPFAKTDLKPALQAVIGDGATKAWPLRIKPVTASAKTE